MTTRDMICQAIQNVFLVPPRGEQRKRSLRCLHGNVEVIPEEDQSQQGIPALYFRSKHREDFDFLLRSVEIELRKRDFTACSPILAEAAIALFVSCRQIGRTAIEEELLSNPVELPATIFIGLPSMAFIMSPGAMETLPGFRFGRFTVGLGADHAHDVLFGKPDAPNGDQPDIMRPPMLWLMREPVTCRLHAAAIDSKIPADVRDKYLGVVVSELGHIFEQDLSSDQSIFAALNVPTFDTQDLFRIHGLRIDVAFGTVSRQSHTLIRDDNVIPVGIGRLAEIDRDLRKLLRSPLGSLPGIDDTLSAFTKYLYRARTHFVGQRPSDAFIHYVFALDLALGGNQETTRNTSRRAAVIFSCASGKPFDETRKEIDEIIRIRSKYVHAGRDIPNTKLEVACQICRAVTECLLRARISTASANPKFIEDFWHPHLDYLASALQAKVDVPDSHFEQCGVLSPKSRGVNAIH